MPKTISSQLQADLSGPTTSICSLWQIKRTDGVQFYFTDHDEDVTFEGNTYVAAVGYDRTAIETQASTAVPSVDVTGFFSDDSLNEDDIRAGRFDYALVTVQIVNWQNLSHGSCQLRQGTLGECIFTDTGTFTTELRGLTQSYTQTIGETYTPSCRATFGDWRCKTPLAPVVVTRGATFAAGDYVRSSPALVGQVNPTFYVPADVNANDISTIGAAATLGSDAVQTTSLSKYGAGSLHFTPSSQINSQGFVQYPYNAIYGFGANVPFSMAGWVNFDSLSQTEQTFASFGDDFWGWSWRVGRNGTNMEFIYSSDGSTLVTISEAATWATGAWHHWEVDRDAAGNIYLFLDGVLLGSDGGHTAGFHTDPHTFVYLGKSHYGNPNPNFAMTGYLDDIRIVNGACINTATFTPPTAAYGIPDFPALIAALVTSDFEDRIYLCTSGGTTNVAAQPTYDTNIAVPAAPGTNVLKIVSVTSLNGETVTIGSTVYTFRSAPTPSVSCDVHYSTPQDAIFNLCAAINNNRGIYVEGPTNLVTIEGDNYFQRFSGTSFGALTPTNDPNVGATIDVNGNLLVTSILSGTGVNSIATTSTLTDAGNGWQNGTTLTGGAAATGSSGSTTDGTCVFETIPSWTRAAIVTYVDPTDKRYLLVQVVELRDTTSFLFGEIGGEAVIGNAVVAAAQFDANEAGTGEVIVPWIPTTTPWFTSGGVKFDTGLNAGLGMEVKNWFPEQNSVELFLALPYVPAVGDTLAIWTGCNKTMPMCTNRFNDLINMRAEPFVPGQDALVAGV